MEEEIFDSEFFEKLNKLKLSLNLRLTQGMSGGRKSNAKGSSVEFSDFREYMIGDDLRRIDWNLYARMEKLFIKQFMEEKQAIFSIFIDVSKSMDFGEKSKSSMALKIAGAFAYLVLNNLDRVYIKQMSENSLVIGKGLQGRLAYKKILSDLKNIKFDGKTNLEKSIKSRPLSINGVSVVISDFLDENENSIENMISYLRYKKQKIVLIQISAREEIELELEGTYNFIDMENNNNLKITISRESILEYKKKREELEKKLEQMSKKYGMYYVNIISDEDIEQVMFNKMKTTTILATK